MVDKLNMLKLLDVACRKKMSEFDSSDAMMASELKDGDLSDEMAQFRMAWYIAYARACSRVHDLPEGGLCDPATHLRDVNRDYERGVAQHKAKLIAGCAKMRSDSVRLNAEIKKFGFK